MSGGASNTTGRLRLRASLPAWFDGKGPEGDVVISTRVRLARNLAGHKFPARASAREKQKIFKEAEAAILNLSKQFGRLEIINFVKLKKLEQYFLVEERMASADMLKGEGDRGVACDVLGKFCVMINEEDHLRIQKMASGYHTFELWEAASRADDDIGRGLKYAYSERLGFLTACPTNSGTGLRVSYLMHLPGLVLTKSIEQVLQGASQMGIATRGFFGECSDVVGNFFQLSNQATMGASETEFIESTSKVIKEVIDHERKARERLAEGALLEVIDKVSRACGILCSARVLSFTELLSLTSALRLGIDCGIYNGHTVSELNKMVMLAMPAHLQAYISGSEDRYPDPDVARADAIREFFGKKKAVVKKKAARKPRA